MARFEPTAYAYYLRNETKKLVLMASKDEERGNIILEELDQWSEV